MRQNSSKVDIALVVFSAIWLLVILRLGVWRATVTPSHGVLSYTFNGWSEFPATHHGFLAQYNPDDFYQKRAYTSYTYPFVFFNFAFLAPFHFLFKVPYEIAANFLPYLYVICLTALLIFTRRHGLRATGQTHSPLRWLVAFVAIGIVVTGPLPWVAELKYNRDNFHILAAAAFCYLSTFVFRDEVPKKPLLFVGVFLALWSPIYVPAWILAALFLKKTLVLEREWIFPVVGVSALAWLDLMLPRYVCRWANLTSVSSAFLYRSGLDGSIKYTTGIYQAVFEPFDPRHWPTMFYVFITVSVALALRVLLGREYRTLQQAFFLVIPYCTLAILLPQFTSIHPYLTDPALAVPATFAISFWFLDEKFFQMLNPERCVVWALTAALILMTNLLTISQNLNR